MLMCLSPSPLRTMISRMSSTRLKFTASGLAGSSGPGGFRAFWGDAFGVDRSALVVPFAEVSAAPAGQGGSRFGLMGKIGALMVLVAGAVIVVTLRQ